MYFKMNVSIEKGRLDITPLIDVVFQLIIFFMLSSSFILQPGIKVDLPTVNIPNAEKPTGPSITIRRDGRLFLNDKEIHLSKLEESLKFEKEGKGDDIVLIIKADQKTPHGKVVEVMAIAKNAGFGKIGIATKPGFEKGKTY